MSEKFQVHKMHKLSDRMEEMAYEWVWQNISEHFNVEEVEDLITHEDEDLQRVGYDVATSLQQDQLVFPEGGEPYEDTPYKGYDYLDDTKDDLRTLQINLKNAYDEFNNVGALGKHILPGQRDFEKKNEAAVKVNRAFKAAQTYAKKISDEQGERSTGKVFAKLFGPYLPKKESGRNRQSFRSVIDLHNRYY